MIENKNNVHIYSRLCLFVGICRFLSFHLVFGISVFATGHFIFRAKIELFPLHYFVFRFCSMTIWKYRVVIQFILTTDFMLSFHCLFIWIRMGSVWNGSAFSVFSFPLMGSSIFVFFFISFFSSFISLLQFNAEFR